MTAPPAYEVIATAPAFEAALRHLRGQTPLALDLEMENQRHHYGLHVALVQVSTPGRRHFIFDPVAGADVRPLGALFADPGVELIVHDAEFDRRACRTVYGWRLTRVFDTKIAAQFCGYRQFGLANLLQNLLGVQTDKKFQKMNWLKRPLPTAALDYAARDTASLHALRDLLERRLVELGRLDWVREECRHAGEDTPPEPDPPPLHHRIKHSALLTPRQLAVLGALAEFRDGLARELNRPVHFIIRNDLLLEMAIHPPATAEALRRIPSLHPSLYRGRLPHAFLDAVRRGQDAPEEQHSSRRLRARSIPGSDERVKAMQAWRALLAAPYGLEPYLMLANDVLQWAARHPDQPMPPDVAAQIRDWQRPLAWEPFRRRFLSPPDA